MLLNQIKHATVYNQIFSLLFSDYFIIFSHHGCLMFRYLDAILDKVKLSNSFHGKLTILRFVHRIRHRFSHLAANS